MKKVTFLINKKNNWIEKFIKLKNFKVKKKYKYTIAYNHNKVNNEDIVFVLSYTKILPTNFLKRNNLNIVIHSSNLPKDKGFAPMSYQVLRGEKKIFNTMFKIDHTIDGGDVCFKNYFKLNGTELYDELRKKQAESIIDLMSSFLESFPKIKFKKQKGKENFNKRRKPEDSRININKSLKSQFNLLRITDNKSFPSFFIYKGIRFLISLKKQDE
tara:strand:- start:550 stop:1191 length:642 start_codon:yes stop_codon:yes gene_type:complete